MIDKTSRFVVLVYTGKDKIVIIGDAAGNSFATYEEAVTASINVLVGLPEKVAIIPVYTGI